MSILERLVAIQRALGLSDREFAARLGVNHGLWNQTRIGRQRLGDTVLAGAMNAFPEMEQDIIAYRVSALRERARELQAARQAVAA